jgi:hypothetical protein
VRCPFLILQVVGFAAGLASASFAEETRAPAAQTYVLTRLSATDNLLLRKVLLRNDTTGEDLMLKGQEGPLLVAAEPGAYYLRRVDTHFENLRSLHIPKPKLLFQVELGKVNYLGDLHFTYAKQGRRTLSWDFLLNLKTLRAAYAHDSELFRAIPMIGLRPGQPPVEFQREEQAEVEEAPAP